MTTTPTTGGREPVAIIGMGCRLPGGIDSPGALWQALIEGRDHTSRIPAARWETMVAHLHPDQVPAEPYPAGVIDGVVDHAAFGISADEAAEMDPQQGWLLESCYEAIADAGLGPEALGGSATGVYVGAASIDQAAANFAPGRRAGVFTASGAGMALLANRVSYHLNLDGPSLAIDTACSASLTALHYAVRDLRSGAVEYALVGGTNILNSATLSASFVETGVLAPDGSTCAPFDARACGYVRAEGAAMLLLTRESLARERGHREWAQVIGTAIGHGGRAPHLLAPRAERQSAVITRALADADIKADRVGWVQAHGTGTRAGDRVEARGIADALGRDVPVPVGSIKGSVGHLEGAAGVAGVMAAALTLHHGVIPPTVNHSKLRGGLEALIRVPTTREEWPWKRPTAGVSGFGFGGATAHVLLAEGSPLTEPEAGPVFYPEIVLVSGHTPAALAHVASRLATRVPTAGSVDNVAHASLARGPHLPYRAAVLATKLDQLTQDLRHLQQGSVTPNVIGPRRRAGEQRPQVVFVYTGHGGHALDAGRSLMQIRHPFATAVFKARHLVKQYAGSGVWSPDPDPDGAITGFAEAQHCTSLVQIGLTALLASQGITPDLVVGHSVGEVAAAHTAGVLSLDDAMRVLAERARLLGGLSDEGGLLAIRATADDVDTFIAPFGGRVTIAAYNAPELQVVAGPHRDLDRLQATLADHGVWFRPVQEGIPAHSPLVAPVVPALREALAGLRPQEPRIPIISTAHPDRGVLWNAAYWGEQARRPVRFTDAIRAAQTTSHSQNGVVVEIGPSSLLTEHITQILDGEVPVVGITADPAEYAHAIGELYTHGVTPTGPTHQAHPDMVILPGWDHTGAPPEADQAVRAPDPARVGEYLEHEISRLVPLPAGLDLDVDWSHTGGMSSHHLLALLVRLRQVPAWSRTNIELFLPARTWRQVAHALADLLNHTTTQKDHS